jgi:hypothetical protein
MTAPPLIGSALAVAAVVFYPLHGAKPKEVKRFLSAKSEVAEVEGA